ncbi:MAG: hypothetical protein HC830_08980 [Bacteroidetes bacterium]|nr:hypothetical protein [Bacteroidota bacterium]
MMTDAELRSKGMSILSKTIGKVEAERFISLMIRDPFDYTQWQDDLWSDVSIEQLSKTAMH